MDGGALERAPSGERLIEHHTYRIPVGGGPERIAADVLGRHIKRRAGQDDDALIALREIDDQPEVEQDHPAARRDHYVGRLDVAVQPPAFVQETQPFSELPEHAPQPALVEGRWGARPAGRRGDWSAQARLFRLLRRLKP